MKRVSSNSNNQLPNITPLPLTKHLLFKKCVLMHKLIHGKCPVYLEQMFASTLKYNVDSRLMTLTIPRPRLNLFKSSLKFSGTSAWNKLPKLLKGPCSTNNFKDKLLQYLNSLDPTWCKTSFKPVFIFFTHQLRKLICYYIIFFFICHHRKYLSDIGRKLNHLYTSNLMYYIFPQCFDTDDNDNCLN